MKESERLLRERAAKILLKKKEDPLFFYNPHPGQIRFHKAWSNRILAITGNGFGKTHAGIHEFSMAMQGRHFEWRVCKHCEGEGCLRCNISVSDWTYKANRDDHIGMVNKYPPPPLQGRIASEKETITKKIVPLLKELNNNVMQKGFPKKMGTAIECEWEIENGSNWDIRGYDQDDKAYESVDLDVTLFDEPFRQSIWTGTAARMRKGEGGRIIITMTPLMQAAWMYDKWIAKTDKTEDEQSFEIIKGTAWDNCKCMYHKEHDGNPAYPLDKTGHCTCNKGYVHWKAIRLLLDEFDDAEMEAREKGEFVVMKDLAFRTFDPEYHVLPTDMTPGEAHQKELEFYVACDPHRRKPPAWVIAGIDKDDVIYILDEFPNVYKGFYKTPPGVAHRFYDQISEIKLGYDTTVLEFHEIEKYWGGKVRKRFMDPRFGHDNLPNTNEMVIDAYRRHAREQGIKMKFVPATVGTDSKAGEIDAGLALIRQRLLFDREQEISPSNMPSLYVNPSCLNVIRMFNFFKYANRSGKTAEGKGPSIVFEEKFKDFADVLRYLIKSIKKPKKVVVTEEDSEYAYEPASNLTGW